MINRVAENRILFTNAAIENRKFTFDNKPQRAFSFLVAEALNRIYSPSAPRTHLWNEVGDFADRSNEPIDNKYAGDFANKYLTAHGDPELISDNDKVFSGWAQGALEKMLEAGSVYEAEADFWACDDCDLAIAESVVNIAKCPRCHSDESLIIRRELAMFCDTPDDKRILLCRDRIFNQININHEIGRLEQLPPRLLLSRDRNSGISLDGFGLKDKVLDPRLGIGMLAIYAAQRADFEQVGIVQNINTVNRTAPYLGSALPNTKKIDAPDYVYALHADADQQLLNPIRINPRVLALVSLAQRNNVTSASADNMVRNYDKIERLFDGIERFYNNANNSDLDANLPVPDFSRLAQSVAKNLGRDLEIVKHGSVPTLDEQKSIDSDMYIAAKIIH